MNTKQLPNQVPNQSSLPPQAILLDMALGFMRSQIIHAAAELKIGDILQKGPKSLSELARETGTNSETLKRLMRALIVLGIFRQKNKKYSLNPLGEALCTNAPMSFQPFALLMGDKSWWNTWGELVQTIKSGQSIFNNLFGMDYTEYLLKNPQVGHISSLTMESVAAIHNPAIINCFNFHEYKKIIDIGGGYGSLVFALLQNLTDVDVILFDLPEVVQNSQKGIHKMGGNFFQEIPSGGDLYILKQILHDWDDKNCHIILNNCREAMEQNGRLLIIEQILEPENLTPVGLLFDLHMMLLSDGMERTLDQYNQLLKNSGFKIKRLIPTVTSLHMIEAIPVS
ncbi:hypothetical protein JW935_21695 [candidate division KSB1 bacterium]|nr:hypothetical protein [candidate division KSB1 bacterium]